MPLCFVTFKWHAQVGHCSHTWPCFQNHACTQVFQLRIKWSTEEKKFKTLVNNSQMPISILSFCAYASNKPNASGNNFCSYLYKGRHATIFTNGPHFEKKLFFRLFTRPNCWPNWCDFFFGRIAGRGRGRLKKKSLFQNKKNEEKNIFLFFSKRRSNIFVLFSFSFFLLPPKKKGFFAKNTLFFFRKKTDKTFLFLFYVTQFSVFPKKNSEKYINERLQAMVDKWLLVVSAWGRKSFLPGMTQLPDPLF